MTFNLSDEMKMKNTWSRSLAPLLVLIALVAGCERSTAPEFLAGPQTARAPAERLHKVRNVATQVVGSPAVSRVIGAEGGSLAHGGHRLDVPAGAVSRPTLFTMRLLEGGFVEVDLHASVTRSGRTEDVGEHGFLKPVALQLSYAAAAVDDPARLRIVWVKNDGALEPLPSAVDPTSHAVTALLEHFSAYALASN